MKFRTTDHTKKILTEKSGPTSLSGPVQIRILAAIRATMIRLVHAFSHPELGNTTIIWIIAGTTSRFLSENVVNMVKIRGGDT